MIIHQFHYSVRPYDAITNHMALIRNALTRLGISGTDLASDIIRDGTHVSCFKDDIASQCDLLLIHHSFGNPILSQLLALNNKKALIYHNITPACFFRHDPFMQRLSTQGRTQLNLFLGHVIATYGVSRYNETELKKLGFVNTGVFPLLDMARWPSTELKPPHKAPLPENPQLIFVGRISPHKNQALLVRILATLKEKYPGMSLLLIGQGDPFYRRYLRLLSEQLGVADHIVFAAGIPEIELQQCFHKSTAYVSASLHEGFAVPLVEAMATGLPVIALDRGAVGETLGGAGISVESESAEIFAEAIEELLCDSEKLQQIINGQWQRLEQLKVEQSEDKMQAIIHRLIGSAS